MAIYLGWKSCLCLDCFNSGWIFVVAEVRRYYGTLKSSDNLLIKSEEKLMKDASTSEIHMSPKLCEDPAFYNCSVGAGHCV